MGPGPDPQLEHRRLDRRCRSAWATRSRAWWAWARRSGGHRQHLVNLFKVLSAALNISRADAPQRAIVVSERSNFPTDLYIAEALAASAAAR
jgi:hypothetical protein